ncbi:hypothetical protein TSUD_209240 [Trifolium subterraneum]|uniref:BHLH domain-containing protein n=1 Tax=Trifolium subterraneum TaxID=3900 RepID=A0A2Z6MJQ3_TRISU|nr:hypothetical protein TSUD_209240 [Trifolium subterraneum]
MEPPLINDSTFSSTNPSLSEIWPHFPPQNNKKRKLGPAAASSQDTTTSVVLVVAGSNGDSSNNNSPEEQKQPSSETHLPKQDYIHVRARRGQATDSHSLAERVIGKALVLDEIINYIQSLQSQVEFLSMKLEAVNSRLNMNPYIECFPSKDVGAQPFDLSGIIFGPQASRGYAQGSQPGWLHMQITGGFNKAS